MKAVIMAGGEGTRLRPLTSNLPKPMMPLANKPMMEHIVDLLKRHGFDEIVVTVAFLANHIRNYFGDGSEFGVRMVVRHRGDAARHRRVGAQRHGRARRALPRHLRRRAHRHRPRRDRRRSTRRTRRWPPSASSASRTRSSSASSSPTRTARSSASSRSRRGARCSPTPSTPASSCSSRRSSTTSRRRPVGRLLRARCSRRCSTTGKPLYGARRRGLLGGRRHARGLRPRPQGHPRRQGRGRRSPASSWPTACGWARAPRSTPTPSIDGPGRHRRQLPDRGRRPPRASTRCSAPTSWCAPTPTSSAVVVHDNAYLGEGVRLRGRRRRPGLRPPPRRPLRGGRRPRRRVLRRRGRGPRRRREGLPVQDGRGRGRRQLVDRVGVAAAPAACSAGSGVAGLANVDITPELAARLAMAYGTTLKKDATVVTSPRLQPLGPHAQAGDDGRAQRRRRQRRGPRGGVRPGHPLPVRPPGRPAAGITVRLVAGRPAVGRDPLLRQRRRSTSTEDAPAQDRAAASPRGLPPGASRRDRRHRLPAPGARALHRGPRGHASTSGPCGPPVQGRARLRLRLDVVRDAERAGQARRRRAGGQPVRLDRRGSWPSTGPSTPIRWPGWSAPRAPASARCSTPTASS